MFDDTDCPVCLALFIPEKQKETLFDNKNDFTIYHSDNLIGNYFGIKNKLITTDGNINLKFNHKAGQIGLLAIDGTKAPSIMFTPAEAVREDEVKPTSRGKTRILLDAPEIEVNRDELIAKCNTLLAKHREETSDIFLTPFRGLREDGRYRRRLDYKMARNIINQAVKNLH